MAIATVVKKTKTNQVFSDKGTEQIPCLLILHKVYTKLLTYA